MKVPEGAHSAKQNRGMTSGTQNDDEALRAQLIGTGMLLLGGILVGLAPIGLRFAVADGLSAQSTAFWRFFLSLPLLLAIYGFRQRLPHRPDKFALIAGVFFALDICVWHMSLTMTSVANATFILNLGNIAVGFLAWIFLKDRPTMLWGGAVGLAVLGAWFLSVGGNPDAGGGALRGDLAALLAALFVSFYMLCSTLARRKGSVLDVLFWASVAEAATAAIMTLSFGETLVPPDLTALRAPVFLAIFVHLAGQGCIIYGVGKAPPAIAGLMILAQPVTAALISWPLFGEILTPVQFGGAVLIVMALALSQLRLPKRKQKT